MNNSQELNKIKKLYGEKFMQLCRELFPTLLEKENLLLNILQSSFSNNCKTLYEDLTKYHLESDFKNYIYSKTDLEHLELLMDISQTPYELLERARIQFV